MPDSTVCLSFDFDAMSVWFGFERTTPAMLNRGEYGARVGVPRILDLLDRHGIAATFFVPGHTVESFPEPTHAILELVEEHGFVYDSSLMTDDFRPFHPRIGDRVSAQEPLVRGRESTVWELP